MIGLDELCVVWGGQCNGDHTVFYRHAEQMITILAVYVDDIIITGDDQEEIKRLKECLSKEFEVKDLGNLNPWHRRGSDRQENIFMSIKIHPRSLE